jgi:hypothetical protein
VRRIVHGVNGGEGVVGVGADDEIAGQIHPANFSRGVDEKFGGARYVGAVAAAVRVEEIPAADDVEVGIRENRKRVALGLAQGFGFGWRIDTDGDDSNLTSVELRQSLLETP